MKRFRESDFSDLPVLTPRLREILLKWISDAMESADFSARTDDGRGYRLDTENVFEDRFGTAAELVKMGADITCQGKTAVLQELFLLSALNRPEEHCPHILLHPVPDNEGCPDIGLHLHLLC